jgi:hypothetical protein
MSQSKRKIANENANFIDALLDGMEVLTDEIPDKADRELFKAALEETRANAARGQEELRSGVHDEALAVRKPPALWEAEKHMFNREAKKLGLPEIQDDNE